MPDDLAYRPGFFRRLMNQVSRFLLPYQPVVGVSGARIGARPQYSPKTAMSAAAAFPWVWAAVQAIATDLSGMELRALTETIEVDDQGQKRVRRNYDDDHPVLRLMKRPNPRESGVRFRRQIYADFTLTGNAFIWRIGEIGAGAVLQRLHPAHVEPQIVAGMVESYRWGTRDIPAEQILHIADISWADDASGYLGESVIRCLHDGLTAQKESRKQAARAAKRGRLEMLLSPSDPVGNMGTEGVERLKTAYEAAVQNGDGVVVLNKSITATPLSFSPRELEYQELNNQVRDETAAAMGVPPTRLGLPAANYGTARAEMRQYTERLMRIASLFDDELSRLIADGTARLVHDFTDVEALQTSYTERQMRASVWVTGFGMSPRAAAEYEGFEDAPIPKTSTPADVKAPRRPATEVDEPQAASLEVSIWRYLTLAADRYEVAAIEGEIANNNFHLVEQGRMLAALEGAGVDPKRASATAAHVTGLLAAIVEQHAEHRDGGTIGVRTLRAFGVDHARHLARSLEAA